MSDSQMLVEFPTHRITEDAVTSLRVIQEEFKHDIAVYTVPLRRAKRDIYATGTPVTITWSRDRDVATFHGYIHHTEPASGQLEAGMTVYCKGAGMALESGSVSVYRKRTVPSVAAELARKFNFDADIVPHGQVFSTLASPGGRYWDFLVTRAKEIGYSFYCTNTRMQLHPRLHLVEKYESQAPLLEKGDIGERGSLFEFSPVDGSTPAGTVRSTTTLVGVNPRTGQAIQATGGPAAPKLGRKYPLPAGDHQQTRVVINDPESARWKIQAMNEMSRFHVTATALADGAPLVHQTWPVILGGVVDEQYQGTWFVRKVTHIMNLEKDYLMELELGRDALETTSPLPDPRARRVVVTRANPQGRPKAAYPASVLSGEQWRSQWSAASRTFPT